MKFDVAEPLFRLSLDDVRLLFRGQDGVAMHLETGAFLLTREFVEAHGSPVAGRKVRLRPGTRPPG